VKKGTGRSSARRVIRNMYDRLWAACGPQHWWPARTPTEVVIGAILTQNTTWTNVERAIRNLERVKCLSWRALRDVSEDKLARLIQPAGTYRVKAARLRAFVDYLWQHHRGSLSSILDGELDDARQRLLSIHGIGPETADAILLYAGNRPTFVVDAYTTRILHRHFLVDAKADYESIRRLFHETLPEDVQLFNEYHALLVEVGKRHCRRRARCEGCPLADLPHDEAL
jgi:endonuclease-3 related protein